MTTIRTFIHEDSSAGLRIYNQFYPEKKTEFTAFEYCFFDAKDRENFAVVALSAMNLKHRNVLRVTNQRSWDEGDVFFCELETETVSKDLKDQLLDMKRVHQEFTETDLELLLNDVLSGLLYLYENNRPCPCIQPSTIYITASGYKIQAFGNAFLNDFEGLDMAFSRDRLLGKGGEMDLALETQAGVYSLGMIGVYMRNPGLFKDWRRFRSDEERIPSLDLSSDMTGLLMRMTSPDPKVRPSVQSAYQILQEKLTKSFLFILTELPYLLASNNFPQMKDRLLRLFSSGNLAAITTFPCGKCKQNVPIVELRKSVCLQHLLCSEDYHLSTESCPLCENGSLPRVRKRFIIVKKQKNGVGEVKNPPIEMEKRCLICGNRFVYEADAPWRIGLIGAADSEIAQQYCSDACYKSTHPIVSVSPPSDYFPISGHFPVSDSIEGMDFRQDALFQKTIEILNQDLNCHFCHQLIELIYPARWVFCGPTPRCVCTKECLLAGLGVSEGCRSYSDARCPGCGWIIEGRRIAETLAFDTHEFLPKPLRGEECPECLEKGRISLECGHRYCENCYQERVHLSGGEPIQCQQCLRARNQEDIMPLPYPG